MRYLILRRYTIKALLFLALAAAAFAFAMPWIYKDSARHHFKMAPGASLLRGITGIDEGTSLNSTFLNNDYVFSKLKIEDANLGGLIVRGDIVIKGQFVRDGEGGLVGFSGKVFSKDVILDSKPLEKLRMSFKITGDGLEIESLRLGKSYELKGRLSLAPPFETDIHLNIMKVDMGHLAAIKSARYPDITLGIMSGAFHIKGRFSNLFSDGIIESRNGRIGSIGYDLATIRFEGFGPIINIVDSSIGNGTLTMEGYVDLRKIAGGNLLDGMRIKSEMKTIVWDRWNISKHGTDELSMTKDIGDNMRIGFKTMATDSVTTYYDRENPEEMSLEYKVGAENLKMKLKENEEFFGIEHKVEF